GSRRDLRQAAATGDRHHARRAAVWYRSHAGVGAVAVRPRAGDGDPVRAWRHLWPLDKAEALVSGLPAQAPLRFPSAEVLRALGASAVMPRYSPPPLAGGEGEAIAPTDAVPCGLP